MSLTSDTPDVPDVSANGAVPQFFTDAIREIDRLTKFGRMTDLGFTIGATLSGWGEIISDRLKGTPASDEALRLFQGYADELQAFAKTESADDMAYLKSLLVVQYVTILESTVSEAIILSLETVPAVMQREKLSRLKGPLVEYGLASQSERAEFLAEALKLETNASLKVGVGRFEIVLDAVGLAGNVDDEVKRTILEMLQVRNVIVHRTRRVDKRIVERCPWLKLQIGTLLRVDGDMTARYRAAVIYYVAEIMLRWLSRAGETDGRSELEAAQNHALEKLRAKKAAGT